MSLRDLAVTAVIFWLLPFCLARSWIGILTWSWLGYMNPHRMTWGFAYSMPFGMMVMGTTLLGLPFNRDVKAPPRSVEVFLLLALWGWFFVTTIFAYYPAGAWEQFSKVSKILFGIFLSLMLLQEERKLKALIWVIAMSIGFFGFKGGIWAFMTGGRNQVLGPPDSFISGNTEIGLALNMVIPLLFFLRRSETRWWLRRLLLAMALLSMVASLITHSRGALLGLLVILPLLFLKSRAKLLILPLLIVAGLVGPSLMPSNWTEKMETIEGYEQDISANQRLTSWWVAFQLAKDSPILGGGFRTFSMEIYQTYIPGYIYANQQHDAHSIYFQVLAEHGFMGLGLFVALLASTFLSLRYVIYVTRDRADLQWINDCAKMVEVSVTAYAVSGAFLSMSYFDLFYHLVVITVLLKVFVARALAAPPPAAPGTELVPAAAQVVKS
jgi:probable O-glycosylation ligase (exosortase A-associated)